MTHDLLSDFEARGLVHQSTDAAALRAVARPRPAAASTPASTPRPTASTSATSWRSCSCAAWRRAGHEPVALVGGATGMIGDPSGRSEERNLLSPEELAANVAGVERQIRGGARADAGDTRARRQQRRLDAGRRLPRVPARRRQARAARADARQGFGEEPARSRRRPLLHRVQLHAAAGLGLRAPLRRARLPRADRRQRPVGQHHRRHRTRPPAPRPATCTASPARCSRRPTARRWGRRRRARSGSTRAARAPTASTSTGSTSTTTTPAAASQRLTELPLDEIRALDAKRAAQSGGPRHAEAARRGAHAARPRRGGPRRRPAGHGDLLRRRDRRPRRRGARRDLRRRAEPRVSAGTTLEATGCRSSRRSRPRAWRRAAAPPAARSSRGGPTSTTAASPTPPTGSRPGDLAGSATLVLRSGKKSYAVVRFG